MFKEQMPTNQVENNIEPGKNTDTENSLLGKLKGKTKGIAKVLTLATALNSAPATIERANAENKTGKIEKQQVENIQERVNAFLNILINIPDNPNATTPAQNMMMKKAAARALISNYCL